MAPIVAVELVRQLFKFGGSFRKEAIAVAITPSVVSIYETMQAACAVECTLSQAIFAVSGVQWAGLLTGIIALTVHLYAKQKASAVAEE